MKKYIATIAVAMAFALPVFAEEIKSRDALMAYLKEKLPDGTQISQTFEVDDTLVAGQNNRGCLTPRTLRQLPFIPRLLVSKGLMHLQVTKEETGYRLIGDTNPACEYRVSHFNLYELELFGADIEPGDDVSSKVTIPIVKQRVLGVTNVDLEGYTSISDTTCDMTFRVWFESYEPSMFARELKAEFLKDHRYKNVFNSEFESGTWCLKLHYDGSYKWKHWSRL